MRKSNDTRITHIGVINLLYFLTTEIFPYHIYCAKWVNFK
jgi:hypothetical protein